MTEEIQNVVLSVSEAQQILKIGKTKFYSLLKTGHIPGRKLGRRTVILRSDLNSYLSGLPSYSTQQEIAKR